MSGNLNISPFNDPLFNAQWYLQNNGQTGGIRGIDLNVLPVWKDYSGAGVRVAVIDDGVDYLHQDLNDNYDAGADIDTFRRVNDGQPIYVSDNHGTAVAGIIAAEAGNNKGSVGIAYDATFSSIRIDFEVGSLAHNLFALQQMSRFDVANNSWNYEFPFGNNHLNRDFIRFENALESAAMNGRDDLGTVVVFSAGNDRLTTGNNANYSNLTNSRYTIVVGAMTHTGVYSSYSNPGANLLVSAFGGDTAADLILTTDRQGKAGYTLLDYDAEFDGTSAAAPMVSGVTTLMLQANPELGYRDVQEILAYSARQTDVKNSTWQINGARTWNGGGMHTSTDYGFGLVDAHAAVRLAETWDKQSTFYNEQRVEGSQSPQTAIRDNGAIASEISLRGAVDIEHVEVLVDIEHDRISDLELVLRSPNGTESVLMNRPGVTPFNARGVAQQDLKFTFSSTQFWGESSAGNWTLVVRDKVSQNEGTLKSWELRAYGEAPAINNTYIYTNEFARFGTQAQRAVLQDGSGADTLNAAAVTSHQVLNLMPGGRSVIAGRNLKIAANTLIENAISGDGNDRLFGNAKANVLNGMRGNDGLVGAAGRDTLLGGVGHDALLGDSGNDSLLGGAGEDILGGGGGNDALMGGIGRDRFQFSGSNLGVDTITDFVRGADKIALSKLTFSAIASASGNGLSQPGDFARVANDAAVNRSGALIVYSQATGNLFYNANGKAAGLGTGGQFATLAGAPALTTSDFVIQR